MILSICFALKIYGYSKNLDWIKMNNESNQNQRIKYTALDRAHQWLETMWVIKIRKYLHLKKKLNKWFSKKKIIFIYLNDKNSTKKTTGLIGWNCGFIFFCSKILTLDF